MCKLVSVKEQKVKYKISVTNFDFPLTFVFC